MQGNQGMVGLALMTDNATVPAKPEITLRVKQFADPMPQFIETTEDLATGTRFGQQKFIQGVQAGNRTIQAAATARDLPLLLTALLAAPDGTGLITPRPDQYGAMMPGQPVAVYQKHPLMDSLFPAAQIGGVTLTIPNRQNVDMSVTLNTARTADMTQAPVFPPLAATGVMQMMHWYLKVGDVEYAPESGTIEIQQGMEAEDGAQGLHNDERMYVLGWSLNGPLTARTTFVLSESGAAKYGGDLKALLAKAKPDLSTGERVKLPVETGFSIGGKQYVFRFPTAELKADNVPNGLGRLTVGLSADGVGLGTPPVVVQLPAPTP